MKNRDFRNLIVYFISILVLVLMYAIPYYQYHYGSNEKVLFKDFPPILQDSNIPLYYENFVNEEKHNTMVHVSSMAPLDKDRLMCIWYSGTREGARDVAILYSIFNMKNKTWFQPQILIDRYTSSNELKRYIKKIGNAVLYKDSKDRLWLFYVSIPKGGWSMSSINYKISLDNGINWSKSKKIISSPFFNLTSNVKNKPFELTDGLIVLPAYHEFIKKYAQLIYINHNSTIKTKRITNDKKAIQPSIVHIEGEKLLAFFRNMETGKALTIKSQDLGKTWSKIREADFPNPNSGFDVIKLSNGLLIGVINYSSKDRGNLTMIISKDRGKTWHPINTFENSEGKEYSYPFLLKTLDGIYHLTYTYERKKIKHIMFNEKWVHFILKKTKNE